MLYYIPLFLIHEEDSGRRLEVHRTTTCSCTARLCRVLHPHQPMSKEDEGPFSWVEDIWKQICCGVSETETETSQINRPSSFNRKCWASVGGQKFNPNGSSSSIKETAVGDGDHGEPQPEQEPGGLGLIITRMKTASDGMRFRIMSVAKAGPANKHGGIRVGMNLTHVNDEELGSMPTEEAVKLLLGLPNTSVELSFTSTRTQEEMTALRNLEIDYEEVADDGNGTDDAHKKNEKDLVETVKIVTTLERTLVTDFISETEECGRFRRLGCTKGSNTMRV